MKTEWIPVPKNWKKLRPHPLSELVEFGVGIDIVALSEHIRIHGYDAGEPIIIHDGQILDGRHRLAAANIAGLTPSFKSFIGPSPEAYVAKKALRQHLTTSQLAVLAASIANAPFGNQKVRDEGARTNAQAAALLNVSERATRRAKVVIERGGDAWKQAVLDGTLAVSDADNIANQPKAVQEVTLEDFKSGKAKTVTEAAVKRRIQGAPIFDDWKIHKAIGILARLFDERARDFWEGPLASSEPRRVGGGVVKIRPVAQIKVK